MDNKKETKQCECRNQNKHNCTGTFIALTLLVRNKEGHLAYKYHTASAFIGLLGDPTQNYCTTHVHVCDKRLFDHTNVCSVQLF